MTKYLKLLAILPILITLKTQALSCTDILTNSAYFCAMANAETEELALNQARDFLLNQISTTVKSASELRTKEISGEVSTNFEMVASSFTNFKLKGLKHVVCSKERKSSGVTVVVYISQSDLEKSSLDVQNQVQEYFNMIEYKQSFNAEYLTDVYAAYLKTFFSPISVEVNFQGRQIKNAQAFLGIILREHLTAISIEAGLPSAGTAGMEEQLSIELNVGKHAQNGFVYHFNAPSINAETNLTGGKGILHFIKSPADVKESIRGYLSFTPINISNDLRELLAVHTFSKEIVFEVDYSKLIYIDFDMEYKGENMVCTPKIENLSPRTFEWKSGKTILSTNQILTLNIKDLSEPIVLTVNGLRDFSRIKNITVKTASQPETATKEKTTDENSNSKIKTLKEDFIAIKTFGELQLKLKELKKSAQGSWGRKEDFIHPEMCWVFLVNPESKAVEMIFTAATSSGRTELRSNKLYTNFENDFKGYIAIWVDIIF